MSINFSANQYEQAFDRKRSGKWELPKWKGKYPERREGFSTIHANSRGHLLPNVPRYRSSPWGPFVGTWDMPLKIPGNRQWNPTGRSEDAMIKLQARTDNAVEVMCGGLKKVRIGPSMPYRISEEGKPACHNNIANPAMRSPKARTEELRALQRRLTPPKLPMNHKVTWTHGGLQPVPAVDDNEVVPRPLPNNGEDVPVEQFHVPSPVEGERATLTGAVNSMQENYIEEPDVRAASEHGEGADENGERAVRDRAGENGEGAAVGEGAGENGENGKGAGENGERADENAEA